MLSWPVQYPKKEMPAPAKSIQQIVNTVLDLYVKNKVTGIYIYIFLYF